MRPTEDGGATMGQREHRAGPATLTWDDDERLAVLRFVEPGAGGLEDAEELTGKLAGWTAEDPGPYRLLVDCSEIADVDAGWRATWAECLAQHAHAVTVAWFNATPHIQLVILMFKKGTGVPGEAFATEREARAWLATRDSRPATG